ncbi:hypothetical protein CDAR_210891 [Caerostris darwini]|uniref:Uncharacterized protein n=1 Tax=Caerostris darwini TaxID=1538125 RepID=A0AAV4SG79_9ARAC|nr:hypothetical protein CDAR_210891 [Caerostris darwini]
MAEVRGRPSLQPAPIVRSDPLVRSASAQTHDVGAPYRYSMTCAVNVSVHVGNGWKILPDEYPEDRDHLREESAPVCQDLGWTRNRLAYKLNKISLYAKR